MGLTCLAVELERRQWGPWNFVGFWIADSFNINTWMISAAAVTSGLSWWQSWLCVWIGYTIAGCFVCITARLGATYHISFPVVVRASFGIWGSLWPVFNRAAMACICEDALFYVVFGYPFLNFFAHLSHNFRNIFQSILSLNS
jgi:NCS1 family nucleobase:cation symporter-1